MLQEGLILKPMGSLNIDVYIDADFTSLWLHEDKLDPACMKSQTGFVMCISNCPIIWMSHLQCKITTSTQEAEYNALSLAMHSMLPFQELVKSIALAIDMPQDWKTTFKMMVWEDNAGALALANMELGHMTPRSKHYAIKMHWFRSHLSDQVTIQKIDSQYQRANILTKGLGPIKFKVMQKLLCGW